MDKAKVSELLEQKDIFGLLKLYSHKLEQYELIITGQEIPSFNDENRLLMEALAEIDIETIFLLCDEGRVDVNMVLTKLFSETIKEVDSADQIMIRLRSKIKRWLHELSRSTYGYDID